MTVDHIIWDWNGTLLGDGRALIAATVDAFTECALPAITPADYQRLHTQPIPAFYDRLAGRTLTPEEQTSLAACFATAYRRHRATVTLTPDAADALTRWSAAGRTQSLLSMCPHDELIPLVTEAGLTDHFTRVDGRAGPEASHKAPHLLRHLSHLPVDPARVLLVGDSVDDANAARSCGIRALIYHAGDDALHARDHFAGHAVVTSLREAVDQNL